MAESTEQNEGAVAVAPEVREKRKPKQTDPQPMWNVILLDDDDHTYEYVILMMRTIFGHGMEKSFQIACEVDATGRSICMTVHKELAELKQEQIHAFGRDPLMARSAGSMSAVIEPACGGGDDDEASGGGDRR